MGSGHLKGGGIVFGRLRFRVGVECVVRGLRHCAGHGGIAIKYMCECISTFGGV